VARIDSLAAVPVATSTHALFRIDRVARHPRDPFVLRMSVLVATILPGALSVLRVLSVGPAPATSAGNEQIVVQLAEDDGAAAHELATFVERYGDNAAPRIRVGTPDPSRSRLDAAQGACKPGTLGVFWLDAQRPEEWRLYVLPCATMRPLVREILVTAGAEQASIEASWQITRSTATALAGRHALDMAEANPAAIDEPPVTEEPPPEAPGFAPQPTELRPPAPARPRARVGLHVGLGYAGEALARAIPWRSGVYGTIAWAVRPRLRIGAGYQFLAPGRLDEPPGFRAWHHSVALTVAGALPLARRLALELRGGPELELALWRSDDRGRVRPRPIPRVGADAALRVELGRGVGLELGIGLTVAILDVDFVTCVAAPTEGGSDPVCAEGTRRVVADTWRVRPRTRAGLSVQF